MKEIIIDGITFVPKESDGDIKIVVADKGHVFVGNVIVDDEFTTITNAKNIRRWGTTKGLGQLIDGQTQNTVLDFYGTVKIPNKAVIYYLDVNQDKWK